MNRLEKAVIEVHRLRAMVAREQDEAGKKGILRRNGDAPSWLAYVAALAEKQAAEREVIQATEKS